jgi:hypothetical protein
MGRLNKYLESGIETVEGARDHKRDGETLHESFQFCDEAIEALKDDARMVGTKLGYMGSCGRAAAALKVPEESLSSPPPF